MFALTLPFQNTNVGAYAESMGLNTEDSNVVFGSRIVTTLMKRRVEVPSSSNTLVVGMDPSGGGSSSMSLVTTCLHKGQLVIVALDESPIKDIAQMELMLMRHIRVLRQHYINHHLIFAFESNLGQEAGHADFEPARELARRPTPRAADAAWPPNCPVRAGRVSP